MYDSPGFNLSEHFQRNDNMLILNEQLKKNLKPLDQVHRRSTVIFKLLRNNVFKSLLQGSLQQGKEIPILACKNHFHLTS